MSLALHFRMPDGKWFKGVRERAVFGAHILVTVDPRLLYTDHVLLDKALRESSFCPLELTCHLPSLLGTGRTWSQSWSRAVSAVWRLQPASPRREGPSPVRELRPCAKFRGQAGFITSPSGQCSVTASGWARWACITLLSTCGGLYSRTEIGRAASGGIHPPFARTVQPSGVVR